MEHLCAYLKENGIRQSDFAAAVGATQATISKLVSGAMLPSLQLAVKIQSETQGRVTCESWVNGAREDAA